MHSFELLMNEHELLGEMAKDVEQLLDPGKPRPDQAITARDRLATALHDHLAHEDAETYPLLIASNDGKTAQTAVEFQGIFGDLVVAWTAYLAQWTVTAATRDWTGFVAATRSVLARLAGHIREENALLYPAALSASIIVLRQTNAAHPAQSPV